MSALKLQCNLRPQISELNREFTSLMAFCGAVAAAPVQRFVWNHDLEVGGNVALL